MQAVSLLDLTLTASGAVAARRAVTFAGAQASVQGAKVIGVAAYGAASAVPFVATVRGTAIVESGAAIAIGDSLIVDSQGRAIPTTGALGVAAGATPVTSTAANGGVLTGGDMPEHVFGDALQAAADVGEFIEVLLRG